MRHANPYVVDVRGSRAHLVVFGSGHSSDPDDPMFDQIEATFSHLEPAFALHEGTPPAVEPQREIAIRRHGEAGLVRHLAARDGVGTASMDIPLPDEARTLCAKIGQRDSLVFLVVRQLASYNRKTARMNFDGYFGDFFDLIAPPLGLDSIDWPLIEREHRRLMGSALRTSDVTAAETDPMRAELPTQRIATLSNRLRDEHMLNRLIESLDEHRRVFATVGVSHAVMLEPALRAGIS